MVKSNSLGKNEILQFSRLNKHCTSADHNLFSPPLKFMLTVEGVPERSLPVQGPSVELIDKIALAERGGRVDQRINKQTVKVSLLYPPNKTSGDRVYSLP